MSDLTVSVVIVSRERPLALARCLVGVSQLRFAPFEIVVVADPAGLEAARLLPFANHLKLVEFDQANISAARNLGLTHAAGEIVAFIDDDAVPEPTWLRYLTAPAVRADVAAMGGFVRGRNGISFQYRAQWLDGFGAARHLDVDSSQSTVLHPPEGRAIKTEGTNMAFRRDVLTNLGGFDPAFRYYLDETDVNMRLARAGHATALTPLAEVHHGFAASRMRRGDRVPRDLYEVGASWAVFQRKHNVTGDHSLHWQRLRSAERRRLLVHMVAGRLEPRDVGRLLRRLDEGYAEGQIREHGRAEIAAHPVAPFAPFPVGKRGSVLHTSSIWQARKAYSKAVEAVAGGEIVTLLVLSRTALYHRLRFTSDGVWEQRGGLFGKITRTDRLFSFRSMRRTVAAEHERIRLQRGLTE